MRRRAPDFWQRPDAAAARILDPIGRLYGSVGRLARPTTRRRASVPVVCIGNAVVGGAGKTPVAIAVAALLAGAGLRPHFLSRGYGGRLKGPVRIYSGRYDARHVGDEPLLLAQHGPTWVARNRHAGAVAAVAAGAGSIVMDDGFRNRSLAPDLSLLVADGEVGYGNGRVFPAGPLREPPECAHACADGLIVVGPERVALPNGLPRIGADLVPVPGSYRLAGKRVLAFAGIGRPAKFLRTLQDLGAEVVDFTAFPDHHRYRRAEVRALFMRAAELNAQCFTTEKDFVRLPVVAQAVTRTVAVMIRWTDPPALPDLLKRNGIPM